MMDLTPKQERCLVWITVAIVLSAVTDLVYSVQAFVMNWLIMPNH